MFLIAVGVAFTPATLDAVSDARLAGQSGEPVRVGRIIIQGNTVTADRVILNQLPFRTGQPFRYALLREGHLNLARMDWFSGPPDVRCFQSEEDERRYDILVSVKEVKTGSIQLTVKLTSEPAK